MLILSLDTAFSHQNFTLLDGKERKVLLRYGEDRGRKSLEIFPKIFEDLKVEPSEVDLFAVNIGPGYSTSLRVGITMVKTYCQVLNKPLITYTSFDAISFHLEEGFYLPLVKVSRYWVYSLVEVSEKGFRYLERVGILSAERFKEILSKYGKSPTLTVPVKWKDEAENLPEELKTDVNLKTVPIEGFSYEGSLMALQKAEKEEFADLLKVEPLYFRPPV